MTHPLEHRWQFLLALSQGGDAHAYEALLQEMGTALSRWLKRKVVHEEEREEVVQEVLFAVHQAKHTYQPDKPFATWVNAIAHYKVVDYYRRRSRKLAREVALDLDSFETSLASSNEGAFGSEREGGLDDGMEEALARLPEKQRRAVELLKLEDLSVREAASRMSVTESSLKVLAHRGYEALRLALGVERKKGR